MACDPDAGSRGNGPSIESSTSAPTGLLAALVPPQQGGVHLSQQTQGPRREGAGVPSCTGAVLASRPHTKGFVVTYEDSSDDEDSEAEEAPVSPPSIKDLGRLQPLGVINDQTLRCWLTELRDLGVPPAVILRALGLKVHMEMLPDKTLWAFLSEVLDELAEALHPRVRLLHFNTLGQAVNMIKDAKRIVCLVGAGISVSCGIPDFRSKDGIYSKMGSYGALTKPTDMFDLAFFRGNSSPFYTFAPEILPGCFTPSITHRFLAAIEKKGRMQRCYTQNIDGLERQSGIEKVLQCHGTFSTFTCQNHCGYKTSLENVRARILRRAIPVCPVCHPEYSDGVYIPPLPPASEAVPAESPNVGDVDMGDQTIDGADQASLVAPADGSTPDAAPGECVGEAEGGVGTEEPVPVYAEVPPVATEEAQAESAAGAESAALAEGDAEGVAAAVPFTMPEQPRGVLKPDIVFFGEKLPDLFDTYVDDDCREVDLLLVIGSSLKVKPVAGLLGRVPRHIPQILINRERVGAPHEFDVELLGDADHVCTLLSQELGWGEVTDPELYDGKIHVPSRVAYAAYDNRQWAYKVFVPEPRHRVRERGERLERREREKEALADATQAETEAPTISANSEGGVMEPSAKRAM
ncbi:sirtuin family protein [Kipferlia bialata]|uniref:Sirtuin family protein n=1 Tax=Kipferlia bialata TaxID=797122 RepID=A0A9K3CT89_9EUKA|nr:sirtuin family protein [Kipferlia bialata]|eukprot:g4045.t1